MRTSTFAMLSAAAALLLAFATSPEALAQSAVLQSACFPPAELAEKPGEEIASKGNHTYDAPAKLAGLAPATPIPDTLRGSIRRVDLRMGQKVIALTFDLCEQRGEIAGYDGRIIDYLRKEGVKATFFAGGKWMTSHKARTQQLMLDPLFEIGNHTETHSNLRLDSPDRVRQEVLAPQRVYEMARADLSQKQCTAGTKLSGIPAQPRVFRFPYGACNDATLKAVNDAGMLAIQWDVATGDPNPHVTAAMIANAMMREAKSGSIIVNHANGRGWHTAEALPIAIPALKAKGYKFVTVSELVAMGKPAIATECYDRHPGDTTRYDFLSALEHPLNAAGTAPQAVTSTPAAKEAKHPERKEPDSSFPSLFGGD